MLAVVITIVRSVVDELRTSEIDKYKLNQLETFCCKQDKAGFRGKARERRDWYPYT